MIIEKQIPIFVRTIGIEIWSIRISAWMIATLVQGSNTLWTFILWWCIYKNAYNSIWMKYSYSDKSINKIREWSSVIFYVYGSLFLLKATHLVYISSLTLRRRKQPNTQLIISIVIVCWFRTWLSVCLEAFLFSSSRFLSPLFLSYLLFLSYNSVQCADDDFLTISN